MTVLVGNKSDMEEEREVEWAEASRWAAENGNIVKFVLSALIDATCRDPFPGGIITDGR